MPRPPLDKGEVQPSPPPVPVVRYRVAARGGLNSLDYGAVLTDDEAASLSPLTLAYLVEVGVLERVES